jgi:hypothetical protein
MRTTKGEAIMNGSSMKASPERSMIKRAKPAGKPQKRINESLEF